MAALDFYSALASGGLSGVSLGNKLPSSFIGPVKPSTTIGGVSPFGQSTGSVLGASTSTLGGRAPAPAPTGNVFSGAEDAARSQNDALLSQALSQYDYNRDALNQQLSSLGGQRETALSSLDTELTGVKNQVGSSKTNARSNYDTTVQDALSTAQETQRSSRNTLRALGILNSSAAGELLQKPLTQYDTQRARLGQALTQRLSELDDFLNQKTSEHANAVAQIQQQFTDLVGRIQNDLRFNDRQRADAVQSANAALLQRLSEIKQAQFNYQSQVNALKQQTAQGLSQLASYQSPTADLGSISGAGYTAPAGASTTGINIYDPNQKKKLGDLGFLSNVG